MQSLRLGKTSKTIQSSHQLNFPMPAKPYHKVPSLFILWTLPSNSTTSLGSLLQCLTTLSVNKSFPKSPLNLPWCHMRPFPFVLSLAAWKKRPTLTGTSYSHEGPLPGLSCCLKLHGSGSRYLTESQSNLVWKCCSPSLQRTGQNSYSWYSRQRWVVASYPGSAHKAVVSLCTIMHGWAWLLPGTVTGANLYLSTPLHTGYVYQLVHMLSLGCQYLRNTPKQKYFTCFTWSYNFSNGFTQRRTQQ